MDYLNVFLHAAGGKDDSDDLRPRKWGEVEWRKLLAATAARPFRASEVVIQRGVADRTLYFVAAGSLEVGVTYVDGVSMTPLARIVAGSVIGEQSFFDGHARSASVWAVTDGELLALTYERFQSLAQGEPVLVLELLFALGRILSLRLRNTTLRVRR